MKRICLRITSVLFSIVMLFGTLNFFPSFQVSAATNEKIIYDFLVGNLGFNAARACGVLANIEKESGFNPNLLEHG